MKRLSALAVIPLLIAALVAFSGGRASAAPQAPQSSPPGETCILVIFCIPTPGSPSASPGPSASATTSSAAPAPTASASVPSGTGSSATPTPAAGPTDTLTSPASAGASPSASASSSPSASGSPSPSATGSPSPTPTPTSGSAAPGLVVSNVTWTMTVGSATMNGFVYRGNVDLPVAGGGTVQMMEFTVSSMSMSNAVTRISENGVTAAETDASFTASGVTMYATRLSGSLFGTIPVTFTPSTVTAAMIKLPDASAILSFANVITGLVPISMTNVTADQTVILAGQAQKVTVGVSD